MSARARGGARKVRERVEKTRDEPIVEMYGKRRFNERSERCSRSATVVTAARI